MKRVLIADNRICDIVAPGFEFPVAPGLQWVDAPDDVSADKYEWDGVAIVQKPGPSIATLKAACRAVINAARDAACYANVVAIGHTWQADCRSQELLSNAVRRWHAGKALPPVWRDADNVDMPVSTIADLEAIEDAIAAQTLAAYQKSWALKSQLDAATTPAEIELIQW